VKPEIIIIRYGEIGLKKNITRRNFENILIKNIKDAFKKENIDFEIERKRARIYIISNQLKECLKVLEKIFGIISFSPAYKTSTDKKSLEKTALKVIDNKISENKSFALKVNRTGNHGFTSQDMAVFLGSVIQNKTKASVNLSKPDIKLFIEIIDKDAFLFFEKIPGAGGLPLDTQGRVLSYIDSKEAILASWFLMRRGCTPVFIISKKTLVDLVEKFVDSWYCNCYIEKDDIKNINLYAKQKKCSAFVTSYTLSEFEKIKQLKKQLEIPVLYPLIGLDIIEIEKKLRYIGL
jgi:adenylyl- and sulfurtransferase ThiI